MDRLKKKLSKRLAACEREKRNGGAFVLFGKQPAYTVRQRYLSLFAAYTGDLSLIICLKCVHVVCITMQCIKSIRLVFARPGLNFAK